MALIRPLSQGGDDMRIASVFGLTAQAPDLFSSLPQADRMDRLRALMQSVADMGITELYIPAWTEIVGYQQAAYSLPLTVMIIKISSTGVPMTGRDIRNDIDKMFLRMPRGVALWINDDAGVLTPDHIRLIEAAHALYPEMEIVWTPPIYRLTRCAVPPYVTIVGQWHGYPPHRRAKIAEGGVAGHGWARQSFLEGRGAWAKLERLYGDQVSLGMCIQTAYEAGTPPIPEGATAEILTWLRDETSCSVALCWTAIYPGYTGLIDWDRLAKVQRMRIDTRIWSDMAWEVRDFCTDSATKGGE